MAVKMTKAANGRTYLTDGGKYAGQVGGPGENGAGTIQVAPTLTAHTTTAAPSITELHARLVTATKPVTLDDLRSADPERYAVELAEQTAMRGNHWDLWQSKVGWAEQLERIGQPGLRVEGFIPKTGGLLLVGQMCAPATRSVLTEQIGQAAKTDRDAYTSEENVLYLARQDALDN